MAIEEISVDELAARLEAAPDTVLIDVRQPDEYESGHVPGARLVPLTAVPDTVDTFRGSSPALVICKTGARSGRACEFLEAHGVKAVNVAGGTMAWMLSGRDVVRGARPS